MAVTLYRQVKVANGGRRYVRVNLGRGRRPADLSGPYYLRYFCPTRDRRVWEHAGDDLTEAIRLADQKEGFLQAKSAGVPVAEPRNDNRVRMDDAIEEYFANLAAQSKDPKTIRAYRVAIDQFRQSCPKVYVNEVKKQDLLNFMAWLRRQPRKPRRSGDPNRTFFNKTGHVVVFLKAYGVSRILKKSEYPRFNPKPVEYYSADQVKALYAAAKGDEERFTLDYFLKTGVRDGEAGHALYTDVKNGFGVSLGAPIPRGLAAGSRFGSDRGLKDAGSFLGHAGGKSSTTSGLTSAEFEGNPAAGWRARLVAKEPSLARTLGSAGGVSPDVKISAL